MIMKIKLQLLLTALLLTAGVTSAWADDVVETLSATMDGTYRLDNSSVAYDLDASSHIELKRYTDGETVKNFYGLLCFDVPAKTGYRVKSASLRLVSKMIKTDRTTNFYKLNTDISTKPAFATLQTSVNTALTTAIIGTVNAEGQNGKQVSSDEITNDTYKTISAWQNNIDLTVSAVVPGEKLSILFAIPSDKTSKSDANRFFGKNATAFTNSKTAIKNTAEDLIPQLTVTYEQILITATIQPVADLWVRSDNTSAVNGTGETFEIKNDVTNEKFFYGLMSFNVGKPGYVVESATLRLTTRVERGDRTTDIRAINATLDESSTKYSDVSGAITSALANDALASFKMEGHQNKAITDAGLDTKYQVVSAWQHNIDLTSYVASHNDRTITLLISKQNDTGSNSSAFFTKEATSLNWDGSINSGATISKDDLVPQLTIVYRKMDSYTLTVTDAKAATLCLPFDATIPSGITAYTLTYSSGDHVTASEVTGSTLAANTPVLINAENATDYTFNRSGEIIDGTSTSGALTGVFTDTWCPESSYILGVKDNVVAFYHPAGENTNNVPAYRAYLTADGAGARLSINFGDEETAVSDIRAEQKAEGYYNLRGQRVETPTKGLYIINGKKVIIK